MDVDVRGASEEDSCFSHKIHCQCESDEALFAAICAGVR